ncbi:hypothetical protein Plhal304r1_c014g0053851 [Plasmopara halstedii]
MSDDGRGSSDNECQDSEDENLELCQQIERNGDLIVFENTLNRSNSGEPSAQESSPIQSEREHQESRDFAEKVDFISSQITLTTCQSGDEIPIEHLSRIEIEKKQSPLAIEPCESPIICVSNGDSYQNVESKQIGNDIIPQLYEGDGENFDDCAQHLTSHHNTLLNSPIQTTCEIQDDTVAAVDIAPVNLNHSVLSSNEELKKSTSLSNQVKSEVADRDTTYVKHSCENLPLETNNEPPDFSSLAIAEKQATYTVDLLFPVVYESAGSIELAQKTSTNQVSASSNTSLPTSSEKPQKEDRNIEKHLASRLAALQARLDLANTNLANATRTFKLQLSIAESDCKKLSDRNARLKTQNSVLTTTLQRSTAELSKLKTENEIYAAKLPRLQAELLKETSEVDETQAQSLQTQVAMVQLKARSHVLQTRVHSIEAQNKKLTLQLRECQQQLKRKTCALQHQIEKTKSIEIDLNELRIKFSREKMEWKNRFTTSLQRFECEKKKLENEHEAKEKKTISELKRRAEKAIKQQKVAEVCADELRQQLKQCKHELVCASDAVQQRSNEVHDIQSFLQKAHRTETRLRRDLSDLKYKLCFLRNEKKHDMTYHKRIENQHKMLKHELSNEVVLYESDSSDKEDENQEHECCSATCFSVKSSPLDRSKCLQLQGQVEHLQQELRRLRCLHSTELEAQGSVLDALLRCAKGN